MASVVFPLSASAQFLSPGPLSKPHSEESVESDCFNCHVSGERNPQDVRCGHCHKEIWQQRSAQTGLHGTIHRKKRCSSCHAEHQGRATELIHWPNNSKNNFDHESTRFPLVEAHRKLKCEKCHNRTNQRGAKTYLGLKRDCASCHKDPHTGRYRNRCVQCHNQSDWKQLNLEKFDHDSSRYPLRGKHRDVKCDKCHGATPQYSGLKFTSCTDCHKTEKDPHKGRFSQLGCEPCHSVNGWRPTTMDRALHARIAFPLQGKHKKLACAKCHDPSVAVEHRFKNANSSQCKDCHKDIHQGEFEEQFDSDCQRCHTVDGFRPSRFDFDLHDQTTFPLKGRHRAVACGNCHNNHRPGKARVHWRLERHKCEQCHDSPHGELFEGRLSGRSCGECHTTNGWKPAKFDHHGVALDTETTPSVSGEMQGGEERRKCHQCHRDVHFGQFRLSEPQYDCEHCHTLGGFSIERYDHGKQTGFELEGRHSTLACKSCHPTEKLANGKTAVRYRLNYNKCRDCHADPHSTTTRGAKSPNAEVDCAPCHNAESWQSIEILGTPLTAKDYDHHDTGFPLTGRHRKVRCHACHQNQTRPSRDCRSCHKEAHGNKFYTNCDPCHTAGQPSSSRAAEIHYNTLFPLTGQHLLADCTQCHRETEDFNWRNVPTDCYDCHKNLYFAKTTHPPHTGSANEAPYPKNCAQCHRTTGWSPALVSIETLNPARRTKSLLRKAPPDHEMKFPIRRGVHRGLSCAQCHVSEKQPKLIRCTGCHAHSPARVANQHRSVRVPVRHIPCINCHRGGAVR